jgi:hypothetical protein
VNTAASNVAPGLNGTGPESHFMWTTATEIR